MRPPLRGSRSAHAVAFVLIKQRREAPHSLICLMSRRVSAKSSTRSSRRQELEHVDICEWRASTGSGCALQAHAEALEKHCSVCADAESAHASCAAPVSRLQGFKSGCVSSQGLGCQNGIRSLSLPAGQPYRLGPAADMVHDHLRRAI